MSNSFFNWLDYAYIGCTFTFCIAGLIRGFTKDFFSTCAWFASGIVATHVYAPIQRIILQHVEISPLFAKAIAIGCAYILTLMILSAIIGFTSRKVKNTEILSGIDRALGALLGFVRGILVAIVIGFGILILNVQESQYECIEQSKLTPYVLFVARGLMPEVAQLAKLGKEKLGLNQMMEGKILSKKQFSENDEGKSNPDSELLQLGEDLPSIHELMNDLAKHLSGNGNENEESLEVLKKRAQQHKHGNLRRLEK